MGGILSSVGCTRAATCWIASYREIALSASRLTSTVVGIVAFGVLAACAPPRIAALPGAAVPTRGLPTPPPPSGHRRVVFQWELKDQDMTARGDGVARIAYPDSIRLDFFLGGGYGSGAAVLIGDSLVVPG